MNSKAVFRKRNQRLKKNEIFAELNKNMPELAGGKTPTVLTFAVDNANLALCDSRDLFLVLYS